VTGQGEEDVVEAGPVELQVGDTNAGGIEIPYETRQLAGSVSRGS
jgi:hypothetical protein